MPNPPRTRCTVQTKRGRQCTYFAAPGTQPPTCRFHAGLESRQADKSNRCAAFNAKGQPCARRPIRGSNPPRCYAHAHPRGPAGSAAAAGRLCAALTAVGRQCANHALPGSDPPLCQVHSANYLPGPADDAAGRRCTALTASRRRCRKWAMRGSHPPRCAVHLGLTVPPVGDPRRCSARRAAPRRGLGPQCRRIAMPGSDPPLCRNHARRFFPDQRPDDAFLVGRRCQAHTKAGRPCRNWAVHGSQSRYGRLLCLFHLPAGHPALNRGARLPGPGEQRCRARTEDGRRCRAWVVVRDHDGRGLCWLHAHDIHPSSDRRFLRTLPPFNASERAAVDALQAAGRSVDALILTARIRNGHLLAYAAQTNRSRYEKYRAWRLVIKLAGDICSLTRARRSLARRRQSDLFETWLDTSTAISQPFDEGLDLELDLDLDQA